MKLLRLVLALLLSVPAIAVAATPPLFRVTTGDQPGVLLLAGSVHFLPDRETGQPAAFDAAYADADRIVFELDLSRDMEVLGAELLPLARDEQQQLLRQAVDEQRLAALQRKAAAAGLPLAALADFEPWFVLLQLNAVMMARLGYAAGAGVDNIYAERARADNKPITGLETIAEQVSGLDGLPLARQLELLEEFIDDTEGMATDMRQLLQAWRDGDDAALDALLQQGWQESADLTELLLHARNRRWARQLADMLQVPGTTLVMVGAGHLVGADSVPALLRQRGLQVERLGSR